MLRGVDMKIDDILRKRTVLFLCSFLFIMIAAIITIVIVLNSNVVNSKVSVDNKNLLVLYRSSDGNVENQTKVATFEQGYDKTATEIIEIVNKKDFSTEFSLCVQQVDTSNEVISVDKIYYRIDDESGIVGNHKDGCIYEGTVAPSSRRLLNVKIWIGEELIDNEDQGKNFTYKFSIK